ncbi:MAG: hypothetical protein U0359_35075 [Byssovorax sp.]
MSEPTPPLPEALVTITVTRISDIDPATIAHAREPVYALLRVGGRLLGRTRALAPGSTEIDLSSERALWTHRLPVQPGEVVTVVAEIRSDDTYRVITKERDDRGREHELPVDDVPMIRSLARLGGPWISRDHVEGAPAIHLEITVQPAARPRNPRVLAPRSVPDRTTHATLLVRDTVVAVFSDIEGLYQPTPAITPGTRAALRVPGYRSDDHRGRIYLNHDLEGHFAADTQLIHAKVRLVLARGLALPPGLKVRFTIVDVDDPSNDQPDVRAVWGMYMDPADYEADAVVGLGPTGHDNEGKPTRDPRWEEVPGFALTMLGPEQAITAAVPAGARELESEVILHCPDMAGDRFILRAEPVADDPIDAVPAETGVLTLWHRIDVENVRMENAIALDLATVASHFLPASTQLDFSAERLIPEETLLFPRDSYMAKSGEYIATHMIHAKEPGWFSLLTAIELLFNIPEAKTETVFDGPVLLSPSVPRDPDTRELLPTLTEQLDIPDYRLEPGKGDLGLPEAVTFSWDDPSTETGAGREAKVRFRVRTTATRGDRIFIWLMAHDITPDFTAGDGSLSHAYANEVEALPRHFTKGITLLDGVGYGAPNPVRAVVEASRRGEAHRESSGIGGISPMINIRGAWYFAGRTIIFAGKAKDASPLSLDLLLAGGATAVAAHELMHAFGFPHKCAHLAIVPIQHPLQVCLMSYANHWTVRPRGPLAFIPKSNGMPHRAFCGRHLKELRRTHLEDNIGLAWGAKGT